MGLFPVALNGISLILKGWFVDSNLEWSSQGLDAYDRGDTIAEGGHLVHGPRRNDGTVK